MINIVIILIILGRPCPFLIVNVDHPTFVHAVIIIIVVIIGEADRRTMKTLLLLLHVVLLAVTGAVSAAVNVATTAWDCVGVAVVLVV